ncbi:transcriptional regulator [Ornithinimicrobium sp. Arc0846-15]|nr:transcriptional regulator [Ornithinimicrobium laminariae]
MRSQVAESWRRSAAAGVDADATEPTILMPTSDLRQYRQAHRLAAIYPLLEEVLGAAAIESNALLALTDEAGQLLWVSGSHATLRRAESTGFIEGSIWDERAVGTNAPGMALALDQPLMVTGAEHYRTVVQQWNCVASPIHDPSSGSVLGVLDVTGGDQVAGAQTMAMVRAAALLAEAELAKDVHREANSGGFTLEVLGRREGILRKGAKSIVLSPRHTEMFVVLADAPMGLSGEELAVLIYPHEVTASTVRAEMNRLRHVVGDELLGSRPYTLREPVTLDAAVVSQTVDTGEIASALQKYRGPVLPHSEAPGVMRYRSQVEADVRRGVLASERADLMAVWTRTSWGGDDYEVWAAQQRIMPASSPLQPLVRSQLARLDREAMPR